MKRKRAARRPKRRNPAGWEQQQAAVKAAAEFFATPDMQRLRKQIQESAAFIRRVIPPETAEYMRKLVETYRPPPPPSPSLSSPKKRPITRAKADKIVRDCFDRNPRSTVGYCERSAIKAGYSSVRGHIRAA
jgi:hypothetical protein